MKLAPKGAPGHSSLLGHAGTPQTANLRTGSCPEMSMCNMHQPKAPVTRLPSSDETLHKLEGGVNPWALADVVMSLEGGKEQESQLEKHKKAKVSFDYILWMSPAQEVS